MLIYESCSVRALAVAISGVCATLCLACSDEKHGSDEASGSAGSAGTVSVNLGGSTSMGSGGGATVASGGGASCSINDDGSGCVGQGYTGESLPLDIYIMFDQSGSMCSCVSSAGSQACPDQNCSQTRLDAVREATRIFLNDPLSAGIGVGIGYFGKQPIGQASCAVEDYVQAAVGIGVLPDHAGAIMSSLDAIQPTGETPSGAAIRGACDYARSWKTEHRSHQVVILLLTDGKPEAPRTCSTTGTCCPTLDDAVAAAADCLAGDPAIRTYVLGVGPLLGNLEQIAIAGGTQQAYLVEGGDVSGQVLDALNRIRGDAIPCEFALPPPPNGQQLLYGQVNLTYASPSCQPTYYYNVETAVGCGPEGGWYYDNPTTPQKIQLCPASCDQVSVPGGQLLYTVGCATREIPQ